MYDDLIEKDPTLRKDLPGEELDEYERNSIKKVSSKRQSLIIIASLIFVIKQLLVPTITLRTMDYRDLRTNGTNQWPIDRVTHHRVCIESNCTKFYSLNAHILDVRHFPVLPFCYPTLNSIFAPMTYIGPYALLIYSLTAYVGFVYGAMIHLCQLHSPIGCDTFLFIMAPRLFRAIVIMRAKEIYDDCKLSYVNYVRFAEGHRWHHTPAIQQFNKLMPITQEEFRFHPRTSDKLSNEDLHAKVKVISYNWSEVDYILDDLSNRGKDSFNSQDDQDKFVSDCLPCARSLWWHSAAKILFLRGFVSILLVTLILVGVILIDFARRINIKSYEYRGYVEETRRTGCKIWFPTAPGEINVVPTALFELKFTLLNTWDFFYLSLLACIPSVLAGIYYAFYWDLNCWRLELKSHLELLCEIIRLQCSLQIVPRDGSKCERIESKIYAKDRFVRNDIVQSLENNLEQSLERDSRYVMNIFREIFKRSIKFQYLWLRSKPAMASDFLRFDGREHECTKLNIEIAKRQLAIDITSQYDLTSDRLADVMEKVYVSLRLFVKHVQHGSDSSRYLAIILYLVSAGVMVITVWHGQLMGQLTYEHMIMICVCVCIAILILLVLSNFHAEVCTSMI